ncbi:MAG: NADH-quinone oxidoreductase subunit K [Bacteroidetes bacterium GWD2_45_23]|jgi:NADH-quinone oxidoreductase subunit K|nr:NADH-quinone oxidoreductase subunit NuoK [Proteiniphilum sp.]OFX53418.1 MAG: NADH-quinone oxidoreductase subunit K [Bacteroidetes bacterium GWC2_46_850]OFX86291.1 MAG: NADH-quinone oxidoreductase subunit K [Bacteroidetes bacterium GWD2_45_23]HBA99734.1 NADH-quinone oxidoreductase subunit NuoK [Porphyromonadaceae bacterium]HCC17434.1 NADH-quinone oxidoreductase subunit NuoK [Porphyromonadaceae bacterium]
MGELLINNTGVPVLAYQLVSLIMFFAGIYGFFTRRNLMMILISVELILNAADINFAVFNRYLYPGEMEGMFFALFTIAIAACETAVAIAIIINVYRNFGNAEVDNLKKMKG